MRSLLVWPKRRRLAELDAELTPGRLVLTRDDGAVVLDCQDADELRAFSMLAHAAAVELDLMTKAAAAKALADRRLQRKQEGGKLGLLHRPFTEPPEPAAFMEA